MENTKQQGAEWEQDRIGMITASRVYDVVNKLKSGKPAKSRETYLFEIVSERLTGQPVDFFENRAMKFGKDMEPRARAAYEFITGGRVEDVGFVPHPTISTAGASPDGLVGADGLVEFKVPQSNTFVKYVLQGADCIEPQYLHQMQWQMASTGRQWCDYAVFDPRVEDLSQQLWVCRVKRDDNLIAEMQQSVIEFEAEIQSALNTIKSRTDLEAV